MFAAGALLPWWSYETTVESLEDICRVRERVRSRMSDQRGVRIIDLLLIIDVLLTDAFDSGFAQRDLRLTITISGLRLVIAVDGVDAPVAIGPDLARSAGKALLDLISTGWGVQRYGGRATTWAALDLAEATYNTGDAGRAKPSASSTHSRAQLAFVPRCAPRKVTEPSP